MLKSPTGNLTQYRLRLIILIVPVVALLLIARFFYWQIIRGPELQSKANRQHQSTVYLKAKRGDILDNEGNVLAGTKNLYHLYLYKPQLTISQPELIQKLSSIITLDGDTTGSGSVTDYLNSRLSLDSNWISIKHYLSSEAKKQIEDLKITGLGFEDEYIRYYPEASMSAQVLGFVGQDEAGEEQGYFGIEGFYDRQLKGRGGKVRTEQDAKGNPILIGDYQMLQSIEGKSIKTTIDKRIQYLVESLLKEGLTKYQASAGNVTVMDSKTGKILAMASFPNYDPGHYSDFNNQSYKNPIGADLFEPGSIFKVLVMAAALNENLITPDTICDICGGPIVIGKYTIKTWDEKYYANTNLTDVLVHSDNTGMVFVARKLGKEKFVEYLQQYGFGEKTGIQLQEEVTAKLRPANEMGDVDLATNSFGQGIAVTPIQMVSAVNSLANNGIYIQPSLVDGDTQETRKVITPEAAKNITKMMIEAVDRGEAKRAKPKGLTVAGKTGTAQIPIEGHYDPTKTIASFVGFFPADNPQYTMLVTLREPQTSQWGSETAAPLWFNIAKQLLL